MIAFIISYLCFYYGAPKLAMIVQPYRDDGAKHHHKLGTPTMGGLLVLLAILLRCIDQVFSVYGLCLIGFGALGLYDDYMKVMHQSSRGVTAMQKLLIQVLLSTLLLMCMDLDSVLNFFGHKVDIGMLYPLFAGFLLVATSNAFNLTDGLDGLAATQAILILGFFGIYTAWGSNQLVLIQSSIAALGVFLFYNWYPAKIFMGDVGSLSIGALMALLAIDLKLEIFFILPALVMIVEVLSVIIQVICFKKGYGRVFKMAPIHHHFEIVGYRETSIVLAFGCLTLLMGSIAVWLN